MGYVMRLNRFSKCKAFEQPVRIRNVYNTQCERILYDDCQFMCQLVELRWISIRRVVYDLLNVVSTHIYI